LPIIAAAATIALVSAACNQTGVVGSPNSGALTQLQNQLGLGPNSVPTGSSGASGASGASGGGPTTFNVLVSWTANREAAVNRAGGGYQIFVYYSNPLTGPLFLERLISVPYVAGPTAPTSYLVTGLGKHAPYVYHFKILAYSGLHNQFGNQAQSATSASDVFVEAP
jgi:hypothetical protein